MDGMEDGTKGHLWIQGKLLEVKIVKSVKQIVLHKAGLLFKEQEKVIKNVLQWRVQIITL